MEFKLESGISIMHGFVALVIVFRLSYAWLMELISLWLITVTLAGAFSDGVLGVMVEEGWESGGCSLIKLSFQDAVEGKGHELEALTWVELILKLHPRQRERDSDVLFCLWEN